MSHPWPVVTVEQMRALEAHAFAAGITEERLQAAAAAQIALAAGRCAPATTRVVVLIGPGNNGRDAFLAGRLLAERGRRLFYYVGPRHAIAERELAALEPGREEVRCHRDAQDLSVLEEQLNLASVALDGLLGIGVRGPLRPPLDDLAACLNRVARQTELRVISVDVPSGIHADSGAVDGVAVRANLTVALGTVKAGLLRFPAANLAGEIEARPIGLPPTAEAECRVRLLTERDAPAPPARPPDAHKGTLGWVLVVGGSADYIGAPILSALAAARAGCGLVGLAIPPDAQMAAASAMPEATYLLREAGQAPAVQAERLISRVDDFRAMIIGPGLGRAQESTELVRGLLSRLAQMPERPMVLLDADALNVLAHWQDWWKTVPGGCVLTPHYGEMARLTASSSDHIASRSWEIAQEYAVRWHQVVVLKGPHTVVARPDGTARVHPRATPALATAGSGDVLAGLTAGLAAQGLAPAEAAELAVVTHALAARRALESPPRRSLIASDLLEQLPVALAELSA